MRTGARTEFFAREELPKSPTPVFAIDHCRGHERCGHGTNKQTQDWQIDHIAAPRVPMPEVATPVQTTWPNLARLRAKHRADAVEFATTSVASKAMLAKIG